MEEQNLPLNDSILQEATGEAGTLTNRTSNGFKFVLSGAAILVTSCVMALISGISDPMFDYILYGLTSVGACVVIYGLYCVFE
jgi:O-antigen/teichoic acid export membrane protein